MSKETTIKCSKFILLGLFLYSMNSPRLHKVFFYVAIIQCPVYILGLHFNFLLQIGICVVDFPVIAVV